MKIITKFVYAAVAVVILAIVITTSASGQGVNDRYYRFEEGVAGNCASGAGSMERQTAVRSTAQTCHSQ